MLKTNEFIVGDTLKVLRTLPTESVDCIITSPPYYGLRDYGTATWEGGKKGCDHRIDRFGNRKVTEATTIDQSKQKSVAGEYVPIGCLCPKCGAKRIDQQLGLEPTLDEYLNKMLLVTNELKRVLKKTGTMFWNHGDSYASQGNEKSKWAGDGQLSKAYMGRARTNDVPAKSLMLQNYRLAQRMVDEQGWILRNVLIWHKPNCMPSSVKDRFTVDYEPIFFFSKAKKYWFEQQFEPSGEWNSNKGFNPEGQIKRRGPLLRNMGGNNPRKDEVQQGRTKRAVWKIPTQPFKEAHFAVFPEKLIEPMIASGCPKEICKSCGKGREPIVETTRTETTRTETTRTETTRTRDDGGQRNYDGMRWVSTTNKKGYTTCSCNAGFEAGIVLDPFIGSGTVAVVAQRLGRRWLGIDIKKEYIKMAEKRLARETLPIGL